MATIAEVRAELADVLYTATAVRADGYVGSTQIAVPCLRTSVREWDPRVTYRNGKATVPFTIHALAAIAADRAGEKLLDTLADITGTKSVLLAVETLSNWSVAIDTAVITRIGEVQVVDVAGVQYLAREFDVDVTF